MASNSYPSNLEQEFLCYASTLESKQILQDIENIMADLPGAIKTVSAGMNALQKLAEIAVETQSVELKEALLSVRNDLLSVKETLLEVREENFQLKEQNRELSNRIKELETPQAKKLVKKGRFYVSEDGGGPYCPQCWEDKTKKSYISFTGPLYNCSSPGCYFKGMGS